MKLFVLDLCRIGTIANVSKKHMSWDTVKDILKSELGQKYSRPDLSDLWYIGIEEFAVANGHIYMTIVVDLEAGRIVYVGNGKGTDVLDGCGRYSSVRDAGLRPYRPTSRRLSSPTSRSICPIPYRCTTTSTSSS